MTEAANLRGRIESLATRTELQLSCSFLNLETGNSVSIRGDVAVPVGDHEALIQYLALLRASSMGKIDVSAMYELQEHNRGEAHQGVIGCMSNGLRLSLGDYLAQTIITGDLAAYSVVREAIEAQGASARELVDLFLAEVGHGGLEQRPVLFPAGRTGVTIGSTTTDEQIAILRQVICDSGEVGAHTIKILTSVLKGGGLERGLPGYGPFKTKVAHIARCGEGMSDVRSDSAVYFYQDLPRFLVSATIQGVRAHQGVFPGMVLAEDLLRDIARECWAAAVGEL